METKEVTGYSIILVSVLPIITVRLINIDQTQARVFVNYWYLVALPFIGIVIASRMMK